ncbi:fenitrothion hydrolase [Conexibacter sp. SYSU D00693]|uniref:fenitrothion hydrolase n=1 Tax=Conexibacter sp. SYSU D00693 TaxID=2812560 RepID=UPI00196B4112|nr:fenitrothion hydrolase [Conexibacter sp. SYSU D00693]
MRARRLAVLLAPALLLVAPSPASAHGLVQRADLPIPEWLFGWAAALVLVVSFVALAVLWSEPRLERRGPGAASPGTAAGRALASRPVVVACQAVGLALLALVVWAGLAGTQSPDANIAPTLFYVVFWVGLVVASLLLGDVFRAFNPWRTLGRLVDRVRPGAPAPYPEGLGLWPATLGLFGFTVLELVLTDGSKPEVIAWAAVLYTVVQLAGAWRFGGETWSARGEAFGVWFGLVARIGAFEARDGAVRLRRPLEALARVTPVPGMVALMVVAIGTVTFDGLSSGSLWADTLQPPLFDGFDAVVGATLAEELTALVGLVGCTLLVGLFYRLGIAGARTVGGGFSEARLRDAFIHSLVPIAVVYVLAHYLSFLVFNGQAIVYLASDPLGKGWDVLGTASSAIDFSVLSQSAIWYLQVGCVVLGHVAALALAHDRALVLYDKPQLAVRSQYWMLAVMVGFTSLALWLLASAGAS